MSIEELIQLVATPAVSIASPPWEHARAEVGFDFPSDYRDFFDNFGSGSFQTEGKPLTLGIQGPHSTPGYPNGLAGFSGFVDVTISDVRPAFTSSGQGSLTLPNVPYHFLPDPGGLLQWGTTDSGDSFFWLTESLNSDDWPVVMWDRHADETRRFDCGFLDFLLSVIRRQEPSLTWLIGSCPKWTIDYDWLTVY